MAALQAHEALAPRGRRPSPEDLERLLAEQGGNVSALATVLSVGRNTLYRWLEAAGIDPQAARD